MEKRQIIIIVVLILAFIFFYFIDVPNLFINKNLLTAHLSIVNNVDKLTADSSNRLLLKVEVRDNYNLPVENVAVIFEVSDHLGEIRPVNSSTNRFGEALAYYIPPDLAKDEASSAGVNIKASIRGTAKSSSLDIGFIPVPIIFIHGYQQTAYIFNNAKEYIEQYGFEGFSFEYEWEKGVIPAAEQLSQFLAGIKKDYLLKGIQVGRFDVVAHSMGGLVARYYSTSDEYLKRNDIRKIIFVSVPHKGSILASIGAGYFKDDGIKDMIPDSDLLINILPSMINKGLNNTIQSANIVGAKDEVVSLESASLAKWGIETEIFDLGGESLSVESIIKGGTTQAENHRAILNNTKVFDRIMELLDRKLPYPAILR